MGLLSLLFVKEVLAQSQGSQGYEMASSDVSLACTNVHLFDGISEVGCVVVASRMPIYNFGFVFRDDACMICRAGGTLGDPTIPEITINGKLYVDGKVFSSYVSTHVNSNSYQANMY